MATQTARKSPPKSNKMEPRRRAVDRPAAGRALGQQALAGGNFVELARLMRGIGALQIRHFGRRRRTGAGPGHREGNPGRCLNLAGQTSLWEMIEWVRRGRLVISNDTGPMHVAAALGRPLVALFGPTNPRRTGPYGKPGSVLQIHSLSCVPCMKPRCHYACRWRVSTG